MKTYRARKKAAAEPPEPVRAPTGSDAGSVVALWAKGNLMVPTGPLRGQPYELDGWQVAFLRDALGDGIREAGLSVSRKNGKSGLISVLLLAYLVGPLNSPLWRGIVVSLTGSLAAELRDAVVQTAEASGLDGLLTVRKSPPPGSVEGVAGSRLTILASDRATGHSVGSDMVVLDEAGLLQENQRDLWSAILSSTSGRDGRMLSISIQGDGQMFSELRDRAGEPSVVWHEFSAPDDCALDDEEAWAAANPGLASGIKSLSYMRDMSRKAISIPADAASFRAYDLNQPRSPSTETICSAADWRACERSADDLPTRAGDCVIGFDIGGSSSLTALSVLWSETGRLEAWAACGDNPVLIERSRADGVGSAYVEMERRGELVTYPGRVTPAAAFLADCAARLQGCRVVAAGADRYRRAEVEDALAAAGLDWEMVWRGQGAAASADGSFDVRSFQRAVLSGKLVTAESLLLRSAINESVIRRDAAGNPALDKRRHHGRIDALSATVIACGLGELVGNRPKPKAGYLGMVNP